MKPSFSLKAFGVTDIGLSRKKNEDFFISLPEMNFFALADGMGGHKAGEVAAKCAIKTITDRFLPDIGSKELDLELLKKSLYEAIKLSNSKIYEMSKSHPSLQGMGTTLCTLYLSTNSALLGHVGDSRIYHFQNEKLKTLTQDHSLIQDLVLTGHVEDDEPISSPYKNIITKALGPSPMLEPDISHCPVQSGDIFLLCSDGLSDFVSEGRIIKILSKEGSLEKKAHHLVRHAKFKKSQDNITLILVEIS